MEKTDEQKEVTDLVRHILLIFEVSSGVEPLYTVLQTVT